MQKLMMLSFFALLVGLLLGGCDRFEKPTNAQCSVAVQNLISKNVSQAIDSEFPVGDQDDAASAMATQFLKGVGANVLSEVLIDDVKIAWCEVNMSLHDTNCLRAAQNKAAVDACGYVLTEGGEISKR